MMRGCQPVNKLYLPLVGSKPHTRPMGWALYGVSHDRMHAAMTAGQPVQNWAAKGCCLKHPQYLPTIHSTLWMEDTAVYRTLAAQYPERTWLLLNEPDMPPPQGFIRPDYAVRLVRQYAKLLHSYNCRVAGYGVTVTDPDHWTSTYATRFPTAWAVIGWRKWLDDWNALKGPVPDVAHVHIYAKTRQAWQDQYEQWQQWNRANWQLPTIISECGESAEVWNYLVNEFSDSQVEALLWFTNFTDKVLPGLPALENGAERP